jgi:hypothetical protein
MKKLKAFLFIIILTTASFPAQPIPEKIDKKVSPKESIESLSQNLTSMGIDNFHNGYVM